MEFGLGIVTILALLMTIGMGVVTWRIVREERRRSAARLAALAAQLQRQDASGPTAVAAVEMASPPLDLSIRPSSGTSSPDKGDPEPWPEATARLLPDLFDTRTEATGSPVRLVAGLGLAGLLLASLVSVAMFAVPRAADPDSTTTGVRVPVELLTLVHESTEGMLAISGTVRNPVDGPADRRMSVQALAFDDDGVMVASGRAPLDVGILGPGTESTFAVSLPAERAKRYRISFLVDDTTVPHLDRRAGSAVTPTETDS